MHKTTRLRQLPGPSGRDPLCILENSDPIQNRDKVPALMAELHIAYAIYIFTLFKKYLRIAVYIQGV